MEQIKEYEYVDLSLPSGLKWAKCNIGAETETDYGDYFQWGSTEPNTDDECDLENTLFNEWLDDNDNLKPEYDAAYKATDGAARMPTQDEIQELIDNTIHEWVENFNNSNVNGMKFISKTDESKYIFIPAAGDCGDGSVFNVGNYGYVWSSSLNTSNPYDAWSLYFNSGDCYMNNYGRCNGWSIRPVID